MPLMELWLIIYNNVSQGTAFTGIPAGTYYASMCYTSGSGSTTCHFNFGQSGFTYTPPDGFLALSTANLPEPSISPLYGASPQDHFNTVLILVMVARRRLLLALGLNQILHGLKSKKCGLQAIGYVDAVTCAKVAIAC
jgi:hypothetical protein